MAAARQAIHSAESKPWVEQTLPMHATSAFINAIKAFNLHVSQAERQGSQQLGQVCPGSHS